MNKNFRIGTLEQRRLFYVAITRCSETLVVSSVIRMRRAVAWKIGARVARGRGADAVLITAATSSNQPVELAGEISRTVLAEFARVTIERAESDPAGERYVRQCAQALADLAVRTMGRIGLRAGPLAFLGGMTKSAVMRTAIANALEEAAPDTRLVEPAGDAVSGALFLARTK